METEQHLCALARANEIRLGAAALKRELREGTLPFAVAVFDERAGVLYTRDLLMTLPRWGRQRAVRKLSELRLPEHRRLRELTDRQKGVLASAI